MSFSEDAPKEREGPLDWNWTGIEDVQVRSRQLRVLPIRGTDLGATVSQDGITSSCPLRVFSAHCTRKTKHSQKIHQWLPFFWRRHKATCSGVSLTLGISSQGKSTTTVAATMDEHLRRRQDCGSKSWKHGNAKTQALSSFWPACSMATCLFSQLSICICLCPHEGGPRGRGHAGIPHHQASRGSKADSLS